MKSYEYVRVDAVESITKGIYEKHRSVIDEYAQQGFSYVGYIPARINNLGMPVSLDLIFEKEV